MGIVGPMGAYGAANDTDLTQHLVAQGDGSQERSAAGRERKQICAGGLFRGVADRGAA